MKPSNDREAITLIINGIVAGGLTLRDVEDGEEVIPVSTTAEAVEAITAVDIATLNVLHPNGSRTFVWFVQGNEPEEVAADYGVSLSPFIDPITDSWGFHS